MVAGPPRHIGLGATSPTTYYPPFHVARTFATTALGAAIVPARAAAQGLPAACVAVARPGPPRRPALVPRPPGRHPGPPRLPRCHRPCAPCPPHADPAANLIGEAALGLLLAVALALAARAPGHAG